MSVKFTQSCPTCGRRVDIRASLLGCTVACQHCGGEFIANANEGHTGSAQPGEDILKRVEAALRRAEASKVQSATEATVA